MKKSSKQPRLSQRLQVLMLLLMKCSCDRCANIFWHCYNSLCIVFACLYPFYSNAVSAYILYLISFTFNDFIFSITHFGFNQKIITRILNIVFIRRSHISWSEVHLKFVTEFLVLIFLIGQWSVDRWSDLEAMWQIIIYQFKSIIIKTISLEFCNKHRTWIPVERYWQIS